ncbi:MAG: PD40 domain-containing protein [Bacteroidetes bacterium]|nr:PD40 domain-containing protein [Bacteroidota bacterium]
MKKLFSTLLVIFFFTSFAFSETPLWLRYSAISPDGNTVAFTYKGDIYTVPVSGGKAFALTKSTASDYCPVWAPDSKIIAFASKRKGNFDVYTIPAEGGTAKQLTFYSGNERPTDFSPDGKNILFSATIQDDAESVDFPSGYLSELYKVPSEGGRTVQVLSTPAQSAKYLNDGKRIIYQDVKSPENYWRKHQLSSATKDIRLYNPANGKHTFVINRNGEDRLPNLSKDEKTLYFTSERGNNNFNIYKQDFPDGGNIVNLTNYKTHPVRFLSVSDAGLICYSYCGELYIMKEGEPAKKIQISITNDFSNQKKFFSKSSGASEIAVSPDGKELAFILRGNVFVTSVDYSTTKQITATPEQERSVSFSPDGKAILYASERKGSWKVYQTKRVDKEEVNFVNSTLLKEELIVGNDEDNFQAQYSPDGKKVAFLANRSELKVIDLKTKKINVALGGKYNYSYADGDQYYQWSPDSKYFLVSYSPNQLFSSDVGLVKADGSDSPFNMTLSGYSDSDPKWIMKGKGMIWQSDRNGYRSHGSWGSYRDVYAMLFTEDSYKKLTASAEEYELKYDKDSEKKDKKEEEKDKQKKKKKDKKKADDKEKKEELKTEIDYNNLQERIVRLTVNSSSITDALLSNDGKKLFYLTRFEKGYDLWVKEIHKNTTKLLIKLGAGGSLLQTDKKGKFIFILSRGSVFKISTKDNSKKPVIFNAEYELDTYAERAYLFEHMHRQMLQKFYKKSMHGVDWNSYKKEYEKFLPHISNDFDFAEMMSELLGELNASHTGAYSYSNNGGNKTASLGIFYDINKAEDGITITEILDKGPAAMAEKKIVKGDVIEKIDNKKITADKDFYQFLNHKAGKNVLLTIKRPSTKKEFTVVLKPISISKKSSLLYNRWVENRRIQTEELSKGEIGYIHVEGMNSKSFRKVYSELLGRNYHKKAVVVDTRYNGGGWLHDDLATLLSGKKYVDYVPRGQYFGSDPMNKWVKPSALIVSEGNYSDAHAFPFVYQTLEIGKIVGMPVPGTMTAVWWETQINRNIVFGIPEIGSRDMTGIFLENTQLEPDYKVLNEYDQVIKGKDQQLAKTVELLLKETLGN